MTAQIKFNLLSLFGLRKWVMLLSFLAGAKAIAWSATYLGGNNWAIICANGTAWSYSGSSAGLDTVGPALCPAGLAAPNPPPHRGKIETGVSAPLNYVKNLMELGDTTPPALRTYPPHGYPCLGCAPCPGNPTEYCDIVNSARVVFVSPAARSCRNDRSNNGGNGRSNYSSESPAELYQ